MSSRDKLSYIIEKSRHIIDSLPGLILIKDVDSVYMDCNEEFSSMMKIDKSNIIGHTDYDLPWETYAKVYQSYDKETMQNTSLTTLVPLLIRDGSMLTSRTYKKPILDEDGEVVGILGQANILVDNVLSKSLYNTNQLDKKTTALSGYSPKSYKISEYHENFKLSKRESECLFLMIRGKNSKEIGMFLNISSRTVEGHIENIKLKFNCNTKSELVAEAIEKGLIDIIPKGDILVHLYNNSDKWQSLF
jgi:DNA-binding CsgD family transcriptional regulator